MATLNTFTITPYERSHRQAVLDLIFQSSHVFTHLDWQSADQWLVSPEAIVRLAWKNGALMGILATSYPLHQSVWLRIVALADAALPETLLPLLWAEIRQSLRQHSTGLAAALVIDDWILAYLPQVGFSYQEEIITLERNSPLIPDYPPPAFEIRLAEAADMPHMAALDQSAFTPPWQMSEYEIRQASRMAALSTVALHDGEIIGYQISTLYHQSGHLARLAVLPQAQGMGVGGGLLHDLLGRFARRNVHTLTVNTQQSNLRSQRLYTRFNFQRNGYDLPVWVQNL